MKEKDQPPSYTYNACTTSHSATHQRIYIYLLTDKDNKTH